MSSLNYRDHLLLLSRTLTVIVAVVLGSLLQRVSCSLMLQRPAQEEGLRGRAPFSAGDLRHPPPLQGHSVPICETGTPPPRTNNTASDVPKLLCRSPNPQHPRTGPHMQTGSLRREPRGQEVIGSDGPGVLIHRGNVNTDGPTGRRPCEDGGGDQGDASRHQGMGDCQQTPRSWEMWEGPSPGASG